MLDKAREYMRRRKASRTAAKLAKAMGKKPGVALGGTAMAHDPSPIAKGHVTIQMRPVAACDCDQLGVGCSHWDTVHHDGNLVVSQAETIMAQMAIGAANSALSYIELGDPLAPANPPALSDLTLQQTTGERKSVVLVAAGNIVTAEVTFTSGEANGFTFTEAGLFNGLLGSGLMFARKAFAGITKTASFEMRFTWLITFLVNTQGGDCAGISLIGPSSVAAFTVYNSGDSIPAGGEASVAATFDFVVGANHVDVYLNGQRLIPGVHYLEAAAPLLAPIGGPPLNKGVNFIGYTLALAPTPDQVFLIQRTLA
jgi:hypothetical protein